MRDEPKQDYIIANTGKNKVRQYSLRKFKEKCDEEGNTYSDIFFDLIDGYNSKK